MLGRRAANRITIDVPNYEELSPGPCDSRIEVIDFDPSNGVYYPPVNLNDVNLAMNEGLDPTDADPRFHQQMTYAVARLVLENFDIALGRRITFRKKPRLRIFPHALNVANAFYDPTMMAVLFGYFRTSKDNDAVGIPGQTVFTCLSHDIIAHETTHALVDRLRPRFMEPTNADVAGFHEGFSDIIAILQHFSFPGVLRQIIQETRSNLHDAGPLVELAREFGYATGSGKSLRTAVDKPDPTMYRTSFEAHDRGSILVAAVFGAFFDVYQARIKDLLRIATGGTGRLPPGDLHPDLVNRIATEASRAAQSMLTMCIRAFEYLPPVDITFGDYLRALVTADRELNPQDDSGQRAAIIENFRTRGIYPPNVRSLGEEAVVLDGEGIELPVSQLETDIYNLIKTYSRSPRHLVSESGVPNPADADEAEAIRSGRGRFAVTLKGWANKNAGALGLIPDRAAPHPINVDGFHPTVRFSRDRQLVVELVAQFTQVTEDASDDSGVWHSARGQPSSPTPAARCVT